MTATSNRPIGLAPGAPEAAAGQDAKKYGTGNPVVQKLLGRWMGRLKGVIGPVTDQMRCGSCVSFATTGLVGAMAAIEHGGTPALLSQSDSHFNSSHGANCGGWDNGTALDQMQARGVVDAETEPYLQGFDSPPTLDPSTYT